MFSVVYRCSLSLVSFCSECDVHVNIYICSLIFNPINWYGDAEGDKDSAAVC